MDKYNKPQIEIQLAQEARKTDKKLKEERLKEHVKAQKQDDLNLNRHKVAKKLKEKKLQEKNKALEQDDPQKCKEIIKNVKGERTQEQDKDQEKAVLEEEFEMMEKLIEISH